MGTQCHKAQLSDGHVVGNGGDSELAQVEKARLHALEVLRWIDAPKLERAGGPLDTDTQWLVNQTSQSSQSNLVKELESVSVEWVDQWPNDIMCPKAADNWCGCTLPQRGAKIWLSKSRCRKQVGPVELGETLLHEVLHHVFSIDEARVYRLASRVYQAWQNASRTLTPVGIRDINFFPSATAISSWDGEGLFSWDPVYDVNLARFTPGKGWENVTLNSTPAWVSPANVKIKQRFRPTSIETISFSPSPKKLFVFLFQQYAKDIVQSDKWLDKAAIYIDMAQGSLELLGENALLVGYEFQNRFPWGTAKSWIANGEKVAVVYSEYRLPQFPKVTVFDVGTREWKDISTRSALPRGIAYSGLALAKDYLFLSGGVGKSGEKTRWQLHLPSEKWHEVSDKNAPPALYSPTVAAVGNDFLVYGGWVKKEQVGDSSTYVREGGIYRADTDEWKRLPSNQGPIPAEKICLVDSESQRIHVVGRQWMTWSRKSEIWETLVSDLGFFASEASQFAISPAGSLFWDTQQRRGTLLSR